MSDIKLKHPWTTESFRLAGIGITRKWYCLLKSCDDSERLPEGDVYLLISCDDREISQMWWLPFNILWWLRRTMDVVHIGIAIFLMLYLHERYGSWPPGTETLISTFYSPRRSFSFLMWELHERRTMDVIHVRIAFYCGSSTRGYMFWISVGDRPRLSAI